MAFRRKLRDSNRWFVFLLNFCYYVLTMKKVNVSTKNIGQFAGKWVAIDPIKETIIAVGETLREISPLVTRPNTDQRPVGTVPFSFLVPRKDEGPYILCIKQVA